MRGYMVVTVSDRLYRNHLIIEMIECLYSGFRTHTFMFMYLFVDTH